LRPQGDPPVDVQPNDPAPVASSWSTTSFEIIPRELLAHIPPPRPIAKRNPCVEDRDKFAIRGPFRNDGGHAFQMPVTELPPGDTAAAPRSSRLLVCEDGAPLGPAHSTHDDIRATGKGQFSHWGEHLYFSASDNSDPNANGRIYTAIDLSTPPRSPEAVIRRNVTAPASKKKQRRER
jgi:hypothetical protein